MTNDIRIVPLQKTCLICTSELPTRESTQSLAGRLCRDCIILIREQVLREVELQPKIVQVQ
jgi:hypothetical protein